MPLPIEDGGPPPMLLPFIEGGPPPMLLPFIEGGPPPILLPVEDGGPPVPALPVEEGGAPLPALPVEVDGLLALTTTVETPCKPDQVKEICGKRQNRNQATFMVDDADAPSPPIHVTAHHVPDKDIQRRVRRRRRGDGPCHGRCAGRASGRRAIHCDFEDHAL